MNVTFGLAKYAAVSYAVSPWNSLPPQLIETTFACFAAVCTAAIRSLVLAELASTRTIFAPGAAAWAHSTSSAISSDQLAFVWGSLVVWPDSFSTVRFAAGSLYSLSNAARSACDVRVVVGVDDRDRLAASGGRRGLMLYAAAI